MTNFTALHGFFKPENDKSLTKSSVKKLKCPNKSRAKKDYSAKLRVLKYFRLGDFASDDGICYMIHKETGWHIPGKASKQKRYIKAFSHHLDFRNRPKKKAVSDEKFHGSKRWKELRFVALRMSEGTCELCGARASDGLQLHVDHIKPRSRYPELQWDLDNLQILCEDCNTGKSNYDDTDFRRW